MSVQQGKIPTYRGRFAPSPTGPLHFGSLVAAVASYCQARVMNGEWLLRIEDIDPPREVAGASENIIHTLDRFGFEWNGPIIYQHQRSEIYLAALETLSEKGRLYPCACSRKEISKTSKLGIYPGTCRQGLPHGRQARSLRLLTQAGELHFDDAIQGQCQFSIENEIGDFILKRADGLFAYQLAVAVDDALQNITQVVRGSDLLDSTSRQLYLQQQLGYASPSYAHHPIVLDQQGEKLSKQKLAPALDQKHISIQLYRALAFLGHTPPTDLLKADPQSLWQWAFENWSLANIPKQAALRADDFPELSDTLDE